MIFNYWIEVSDGFFLELAAKFIDGRQAGPEPFVASVDATNFPLLNVLNADTAKAFFGREKEEDRFLTKLNTDPGYRVISMYNQSPTLAEQVPIREQLQELEDRYPSDFRCIGAWNWDGSPIGGVGSPWFTTPTELKGQDVILRAGQSGRQFV